MWPWLNVDCFLFFSWFSTNSEGFALDSLDFLSLSQLGLADLASSGSVKGERRYYFRVLIIASNSA